MRHVLRASIIAVSLGSMGAAPRSNDGGRFMFPSFVVLRGPGLPAPIVFTHAGAFLENVSRDTIAILYGSLYPYAPRSVERVRRRPFIEVAEFIGPEYMPFSTVSTPVPPFERGSHFSRIYLPAAGEPALWDSPVSAPGGAQPVFYELGDAARAALAARGLKLQ